MLLENWLSALLATSGEDQTVDPGSVDSSLERLRNLLYLALAALAVAKVALDRAWARFRTGADLALAVLGLVIVVAGLVNDSSAGLIGQALFVAFRGLLVFYALRAADLGWAAVRRMLLVVGVIVALNVLLALVQLALGTPAYRALGWAATAWSDQGRVQGLQAHPENLAHLLGLVLVGVIALFASRPQVRPMWWMSAILVALALAATGSSQSLIAVLIAGAAIAVLVHGQRRRILGVCLVVILCTIGYIVARPADRAAWERRLVSPFSHSQVRGPDPAKPRPAAPTTPAPPRSPAPAPPGSPTPAPPGSPTPGPAVFELQQAGDILPRQPLLGFGPGQFGGEVAERNNPDWHRNRKLGPVPLSGEASGPRVESFWLHLVMEVGVIGLIAYVIWLFFVVRPLLPGSARRSRRATPVPSAVTAWGVGAIVFVCVVALGSPAFESAQLSALSWTVLGIAWWAWRRSLEEEASVYSAETAMLPVVRDPSDVTDSETRILATDEILALARRARREIDGRSAGVSYPTER
ncbi:hypothetical protein [Micromonospora sp. NPDC003776]